MWKKPQRMVTKNAPEVLLVLIGGYHSVVGGWGSTEWHPASGRFPRQTRAAGRLFFRNTLFSAHFHPLRILMGGQVRAVCRAVLVNVVSPLLPAAVRYKAAALGTRFISTESQPTLFDLADARGKPMPALSLTPVLRNIYVGHSSPDYVATRDAHF